VYNIGENLGGGRKMGNSFHSLILAAGKGTRMKSELPKVVHPILGKPMVSYVIEAVKQAGSERNVLVTGYKSELVKSTLSNERVDFVEQPEQLGTGHAVQCYVKRVRERPENLLVVCGDTPLISIETLKYMVQTHARLNPAVTMLTLDMQEPGNYGRIIRKDGKVISIREAKDCNKEQLAIKEVNLAVYLFNCDFLFENIFALKDDNRQNEFYLTDLVGIATANGQSVVACKERDENSTLGINSRQHRAMVGGILQKQILNVLMDKGVTIVDPSQTLIGPDCEIEPDTTIWPGCVITGKVKIGKGCEIGPGCRLENVIVGDGSRLRYCVAESTKFEAGTDVPPFSKILGTEEN
jgi:bifunctional UDP-N-acetylglucosamine pyrophosphorylase/glucosamine-1-phosphate N-acetyltransferase